MANYVSLDTIKQHLNLDENFDADDLYLMGLRDVAQEVVEKNIDYPLAQLEDSEGKLPASLIHAQLLLIGTWYALRESVSTSSMMPIPHAFDMICHLWTDYKIDKTK